MRKFLILMSFNFLVFSGAFLTVAECSNLITGSDALFLLYAVMGAHGNLLLIRTTGSSLNFLAITYCKLTENIAARKVTYAIFSSYLLFFLTSLHLYFPYGEFLFYVMDVVLFSLLALVVFTLSNNALDKFLDRKH